MKPSTLVLYVELIAILSYNDVLGYLVATDERKCKYVRVEKMLKAKCYDMNLKEVPKFLSTSIEMLDLSFNRIKKLKKSSFEKYPSIRYLLLYENMIQTVEPGTFTHLTALEEIDLSNNALTTIPLDLFSLPSLRNLYVDSNDLINLHRDLENLKKPIKAPLEYLNVADCGLHDIPYMGTLPRLWHLNASINPLDQISITHFSPLCHLRSIDLKDSNMPYCSCQVLLDFFAMQGIKSNYLIDCDNSSEGSCTHLSNVTILNDEYEACNSTILNEKAALTWVAIAGGIGAFFLLLIVILWMMHKRSIRRKESKLSKRMKNTTQERLMNPL